MDWYLWEGKNGELVRGAEVSVRSELDSVVLRDLGEGDQGGPGDGGCLGVGELSPGVSMRE